MIIPNFQGSAVDNSRLQSRNSTLDTHPLTLRSHWMDRTAGQSHLVALDSCGCSGWKSRTPWRKVDPRLDRPHCRCPGSRAGLWPIDDCGAWAHLISEFNSKQSSEKTDPARTHVLRSTPYGAPAPRLSKSTRLPFGLHRARAAHRHAGR